VEHACGEAVGQGVCVASEYGAREPRAELMHGAHRVPEHTLLGLLRDFARREVPRWHRRAQRTRVRARSLWAAHPAGRRSTRACNTAASASFAVTPARARRQHSTSIQARAVVGEDLGYMGVLTATHTQLVDPAEHGGILVRVLKHVVIRP
jgi:hypothetical protein